MEEAHPDDGLFACVVIRKNVGLTAPSGNSRPDGGPPLSGLQEYPAYEAGALVEPTRAQPTQSLANDEPSFTLI